MEIFERKTDSLEKFTGKGNRMGIKGDVDVKKGRIKLKLNFSRK